MESDSSNSIKSNFDAASSVDKVSSARANKRRISLTAKPCSTFNCEEYHYRASEFCFTHANSNTTSSQNSSERDSAVSPPPDFLKDVKKTLEADIFAAGPFLDVLGEKLKTDVVHHLKSTILRQKALRKSDRYTEMSAATAILPAAQKALKSDTNLSNLLASTTPAVTDIELGQLYLQFKRLDVNGDGVISVSDLKVLISRVDPAYSKNVSEDSLVKKCRLMIADTVPHKTNPVGISFPDYILGRYFLILFFVQINSLFAYFPGIRTLRNQERDKSIATELLQSAFWDLRVCSLLIPEKELSGWLLKRGYALYPETMNGWKRRYFTTNKGIAFTFDMCVYFD
jgi:hypothetical protein